MTHKDDEVNHWVGNFYDPERQSPTENDTDRDVPCAPAPHTRESTSDPDGKPPVLGKTAREKRDERMRRMPH